MPLPDGKVCLLALPSECSQGQGPAGMSCLKLFSRYITDRKVRIILNALCLQCSFGGYFTSFVSFSLGCCVWNIAGDVQ